MTNKMEKFNNLNDEIVSAIADIRSRLPLILKNIKSNFYIGRIEVLLNSKQDLIDEDGERETFNVSLHFFDGEARIGSFAKLHSEAGYWVEKFYPVDPSEEDLRRISIKIENLKDLISRKEDEILQNLEKKLETLKKI